MKAREAGCTQLQTDDGLVFSHHIADILKTWAVKPDLIFLNGCNNAEQVNDFLEAGAKCVIGTHNYIDDGFASEFAQQFYLNLLEKSGRVVLEDAFQRAGSTVFSGEARKPRSLDTDELNDMPGQWDWGLFPQFPELPQQWSLNQRQVLEPLNWASHKGSDTYGDFADLEVDGVVQRLRRVLKDSNTAFWMADTACTQELWLAVMGKNPAEFSQNLQYPVERVNWWDVQDFLDQLNQLFNGLEARLPTEAEWEFACRAGTETAYAFGESVTREQVAFDSEGTVAVKTLPANAWGFYEMHGNVWEWCEDDADAWGNFKILCGGGWVNPVEAVRSNVRGQSGLGNWDYTIGFRFVVG